MRYQEFSSTEFRPHRRLHGRTLLGSGTLHDYLSTHLFLNVLLKYQASGLMMFAAFSRTGEVLDSCKHVGVQDFLTPDNKIPFRVFYPACQHSDNSKKPNVGWFVRSLTYFIDGYMHFLSPKLRINVVFCWLVAFFARIISLFMPLARLPLPMCKYSAEIPTTGRKHPLIVFSHGLTGSGEEQALTFAYWAQQGYVVAAIHHCDGSSCKVPREHQDTHLLYQHPDMQNYDPQFRPRQGDYVIMHSFAPFCSVLFCCCH